MAKKEMPKYTFGEEIFNSVTHIVGGAFGILVLVLSVVFAVQKSLSGWEIFSCVVYGSSMILLYTMSSLYHFLPKNSIAKRVFRIFDHCTIFLLIAGTYTPICVIALGDTIWCLVLLLVVWGAALIGITFNAINMYWKPVKIISMVLYILVGWTVVIALQPTYEALTPAGFWWLLGGGFAFTIGAIFYGVGKKKKWIHCVWHLFVLLGTMLQFITVLFYVILR